MQVRRERNETGASAVEFALVFPFLMLVLFGMITTGLTYSDHLSITNAVREAARFGAAVDYAANPTQWADDVVQRAKDVYFNEADDIDNATTICAALVDDSNAVLAQVSGCGSGPASPSNMAVGSCVVKVWIVKPADIELIVAPTLNFDIGAESVSYYGRDAGGCTSL